MSPCHLSNTQLIERVIAYIDGFNFYNGIMSRGWGRYRWLDYRAFVLRYMRHRHLNEVKYFTARMTHQRDKLRRQDDYLRVLRISGAVTVITGPWSTRSLRCRWCDRWSKVPIEKHTDVNIASHLVADAAQDAFDTFLLCTGDADLAPAVTLSQERFRKGFILLDPPRRHSDDLAALADVHVHSRQSYLAQSQLPDPFVYTTRRGAARRIACPPTWRTNARTPTTTEPDGDGVAHCLTCHQPVDRGAG
jgi:uncharacterized LabA/DUF88 family protein